jgi:hypothetical protein
VFLINDTNAIWEGIFGSTEEEEERRKRKRGGKERRSRTQHGRIRFDYLILTMDKRDLILI